jgi:hypothetical protein
VLARYPAARTGLINAARVDLDPRG